MITLYQPYVPLQRQITVYSFQQLLNLSKPGDTVILDGLPPLTNQIRIPHDLVLVSNQLAITGQFRLNRGDILQPFTPLRPQVVEGVVLQGGRK